MSISVITWLRHVRSFVSLQYLLDRMDPAFLAAAVSRTFYEFRNPQDPWINPEMIGVLKNILKPSDIGFEFGSGTSTIWLAHRVAGLTSIEHDATWYGHVRTRLEAQGLLSKVKVLLASSSNEPANKDAYVAAIRATPPLSLDFCFVDGLFRDACIAESIRALKPGGVLVVDNVDTYFPRNEVSRSIRYKRDNFTRTVAPETMARVSAELANWRCVWTSTPVQDTALWIKP